jgi:cytochrome c-type biogenesis protein
VTDLGGALGVGIAFAGGVASFASPCCLPLVPAYLSYMAGTAGTAGGAAARRTALAHGLAFTAGFSLVFAALFLALGVLGALVDRRVFTVAAGAVLVVMGLQTAGVISIRALWRDTRAMPATGRLAIAGRPGRDSGRAAGYDAGSAAGYATGVPQAQPDRPGYGRSLAFGTLFAAGWSPCIGPILGGVLGLAAAAGSAAQGSVLLLAYTAGLAVPFLAVAMGASWVARRLAWFGRHHQAVSAATGALLVALGVLMLTGMLGRLAAFGAPFGI